jgi:hypothetical protein
MESGATSARNTHVRPECGQAAADDAVTYYASSAPQPVSSAVGRRIRELGDQEAAGGATALANRFVASAAFLRERARAPAQGISAF